MYDDLMSGWPGYLDLQCGSYGLSGPVTANTDCIGPNNYEEPKISIDAQTFKDVIQRTVQEMLKENPDEFECPELGDELTEEEPERYKKKHRE